MEKVLGKTAVLALNMPALNANKTSVMKATWSPKRCRTPLSVFFCFLKEKNGFSIRMGFVLDLALDLALDLVLDFPLEIFYSILLN